jgi:hypothetical protein
LAAVAIRDHIVHVDQDFLTTPWFRNHSPVLTSEPPASDTTTAMLQVLVLEKHVTTIF